MAENIRPTSLSPVLKDTSSLYSETADYLTNSQEDTVDRLLEKRGLSMTPVLQDVSRSPDRSFEHDSCMNGFLMTPKSPLGLRNKRSTFRVPKPGSTKPAATRRNVARFSTALQSSTEENSMSDISFSKPEKSADKRKLRETLAFRNSKRKTGTTMQDLSLGDEKTDSSFNSTSLIEETNRKTNFRMKPKSAAARNAYDVMDSTSSETSLNISDRRKSSAFPRRFEKTQKRRNEAAFVDALSTSVSSDYSSQEVSALKRVKKSEKVNKFRKSMKDVVTEDGDSGNDFDDALCSSSFTSNISENKSQRLKEKSDHNISHSHSSNTLTPKHSSEETKSVNVSTRKSIRLQNKEGDSSTSVDSNIFEIENQESLHDGNVSAQKSPATDKSTISSQRKSSRSTSTLIDSDLSGIENQRKSVNEKRHSSAGKAKESLARLSCELEKSANKNPDATFVAMKHSDSSFRSRTRNNAENCEDMGDTEESNKSSSSSKNTSKRNKSSSFSECVEEFHNLSDVEKLDPSANSIRQQTSKNNLDTSRDAENSLNISRNSRSRSKISDVLHSTAPTMDVPTHQVSPLKSNNSQLNVSQRKSLSKPAPEKFSAKDTAERTNENNDTSINEVIGITFNAENINFNRYTYNSENELIPKSLSESLTSRSLKSCSNVSRTSVPSSVNDDDDEEEDEESIFFERSSILPSESDNEIDDQMVNGSLSSYEVSKICKSTHPNNTSVNPSSESFEITDDETLNSSRRASRKRKSNEEADGQKSKMSFVDQEFTSQNGNKSTTEDTRNEMSFADQEFTNQNGNKSITEDMRNDDQSAFTNDACQDSVKDSRCGETFASAATSQKERSSNHFSLKDGSDSEYFSSGNSYNETPTVKNTAAGVPAGTNFNEYFAKPLFPVNRRVRSLIQSRSSIDSTRSSSSLSLLSKCIRKKRGRKSNLQNGNQPSALINKHNMSLRKRDDAFPKSEPPKMSRPAYWVTNKLYSFLTEKLEPQHNILAKKRAENFVNFLQEKWKKLLKADNKESEDKIIFVIRDLMVDLRLVNSDFMFYNFVQEFLPFEIQDKIVPCAVPFSEECNRPNFNPDDLFVKFF